MNSAGMEKKQPQDVTIGPTGISNDCDKLTTGEGGPQPERDVSIHLLSKNPIRRRDADHTDFSRGLLGAGVWAGDSETAFCVSRIEKMRTCLQVSRVRPFRGGNQEPQRRARFHNQETLLLPRVRESLTMRLGPPKSQSQPGGVCPIFM